MADLVGQQLGTYRLIRLLGRGGFAEVFLGEHIYLQTQVAIRVLPSQSFRENSDELRSKIQTLASLRHPNILAILDFDLEGRPPFIVEEYAPNGTLRQRHPRGTQVPLDTIIPYVRQVASALDYIHAHKIVHGDIKPENMLIGPNNEILLSDFGIAAMVPSVSSPTITSPVAGTAVYMAPEQLQGRSRPASDQYSLGIVVYEWLSGKPPFQGSFMDMAYWHISVPPPSLREKVPTISSEVEQVVMTALAKEPQQRFPSVGAFANALEQANRLGTTIGIVTPPAAVPTSPVLPTTPPLAEAALLGPFGRKKLGSTVMTIGRFKGNELVLEDRQVSRHHAEIRSTGQGYAIVDLNSANGTLVNGQRIPPETSYVLKPGDMIGIGDTRLVYDGGVPPYTAVKAAPSAEKMGAQGWGSPGDTQPGSWGAPAQQQSAAWGNTAGAPPAPTQTPGWGPASTPEQQSPPMQTPGWGPTSTPQQQSGWGRPAQQSPPTQTPGWGPASTPSPAPGSYGNEPLEEQIFREPPEVESMPTMNVPEPTAPEMTYRTGVDETVMTAPDEEYGMQSMGRSDVQAQQEHASAWTSPASPSGSGRPQVEKTELSLFAITNVVLDEGDIAFVGKMYTLQAGIARNKPDDFWGEPFELAVENVTEPITFDILLHESENIELFTSWHRRLRYRPDDAGPQLATFKFHVVTPGKSLLVVDFYHERRWLRTMRFEFDAVEQSQHVPVSSEV